MKNQTQKALDLVTKANGLMQEAQRILTEQRFVELQTVDIERTRTSSTMDTSGMHG